MTEPLKTPKLGASVHQKVGALDVELRRVEPRKYDWDHRGLYERDDPRFGHPMERVRLEIWIDGELCGHASRSWQPGAQPYYITRLGPNGYHDTLPYGQYGLNAHNDPEGDKIYTLERLFVRIGEIRAGNQYRQPALLPLPVLESQAEAWRTRDAAQKAEREEDSRRWAQEREAKAARDAAALKDMMDGLCSIRDRLSDQLSNFETNALFEAIKRLEK